MITQCFRRTVTYEEIFEGDPILFGDFGKGNRDMESRDYEEFESVDGILKRI